jgi:hypothetical protein
VGTRTTIQCIYKSLIQNRLALFGWHDLNTVKYVGITIAIAVVWRVLAWISIAGRVGGFR